MSVLGGKKWWESMTAWGAIIFGAVQAAETTGAVPVGTAAEGQGVIVQMTALAESIGALLMALGIRRAASY